MKKCEQTKGQSVLEHGLSVVEYLEDILSYMKGNLLQKEWKLPDWLEQYKQHFLHTLCNNEEKLLTYAKYHDCGKPYCKVGNSFPNHADVSRSIYLQVGGKEEIANLIGWDMIIHTKSSEEIENYCKEEWNKFSAVCLSLAALAEIHSNAKMFGGLESISFKMKWKQVDKRGKQICKFYFGRENVQE